MLFAKQVWPWFTRPTILSVGRVTGLTGSDEESVSVSVSESALETEGDVVVESTWTVVPVWVPVAVVELDPLEEVAVESLSVSLEFEELGKNTFLAEGIGTVGVVVVDVVVLVVTGPATRCSRAPGRASAYLVLLLNKST